MRIARKTEIICSPKANASVSNPYDATSALCPLNILHGSAIRRCWSKSMLLGTTIACSLRRSSRSASASLRNCAASFSAVAARSYAPPARSLARVAWRWASVNRISSNFSTTPSALNKNPSAMPSPTTPAMMSTQPNVPASFAHGDSFRLIAGRRQISFSAPTVSCHISGPSQTKPMATRNVNPSNVQNQCDTNPSSSNLIKASTPTSVSGIGTDGGIDFSSEDQKTDALILFLELLVGVLIATLSCHPHSRCHFSRLLILHFSRAWRIRLQTLRDVQVSLSFHSVLPAI